MRGRQFLDLARQLMAGATELHWRGAIIHGYYALLLECRDAMARWGLPAPPHHQVHGNVRLRLLYANDVDLKQIGKALDQLVKHRNQASYDLRPLPMFATDAAAAGAIANADAALALLDRIDGDPTLRAAAIASIPP